MGKIAKNEEKKNYEKFYAINYIETWKNKINKRL